MGRKAKFPFEEKLKAIEDYLSGKRRLSQICSELQIHSRSFYDWLRKFKMQGKLGLQTLSDNKCYPEAVKFHAVTDYNKGLGSLDQICNKYNISGHRVLLSWIRKYNGHATLKSHYAQGDRYMTKGRKTTFEERIEIVAFCIANNDNYWMTAEKFQVSYQQVYRWVKEYKKQGREALLDCRGRRKNPEEFTEAEKFAARLMLIEAENRRLKMENAFLKKLDEVERRRETVGYAKKPDIEL